MKRLLYAPCLNEACDDFVEGEHTYPHKYCRACQAAMRDGARLAAALIVIVLIGVLAYFSL